MSRLLRLTLLTEIPAPYRIPIFNALASRDDVDLQVVYLRKSQPGKPYRLHADEMRFSWRVLRGRHVARGSRWLVVNAGVGGALRCTRPDVVVLGGWNQPAFWQALGLAKLTRRPCVCWVESTLWDERSGSASREAAKRRFLRSCHGCLVPGVASAGYVRTLGFPIERIAIAPNAVDRGVFLERAVALRAERETLRRRLGVEGRCVISVGRLDPEKGIDGAIRALASLPEDVGLIVVGIGREEESLRRLADAVVPGRVRFLGFLPRDEIVPWLVAADAFVLPSRSEQWGMAINEAVAAGLPIVASLAAGAAHDLVEPDRTGLVVPPDDDAALTAALARITSEPSFAEAARSSTRRLSDHASPERWAGAIAGLAGCLMR